MDEGRNRWWFWFLLWRLIAGDQEDKYNDEPTCLEACGVIFALLFSMACIIALLVFWAIFG